MVHYIHECGVSVMCSVSGGRDLVYMYVIYHIICSFSSDFLSNLKMVSKYTTLMYVMYHIIYSFSSDFLSNLKMAIRAETYI